MGFIRMIGRIITKLVNGPINFDTWSSSHGAIFSWHRLYYNGYKWTPVTIPRLRYIPLSVREKIKEYEKRAKSIEDCCAIQCQKGNYDYCEYMRGMANGLILASALLKDKEPVYLDALE